MLKKISTSIKLYLLVGVMSAFMIGIGAFGIHELKIMNRNTQSLFADRVIPLEQLNAIRFSFHEGILSPAQRLKTQQVSSVQAIEEIIESQKTINRNWNEYKLTYFTDEESKLVKQADGLMIAANAAIDKLKLILTKKNLPGLNDLIRNELQSALPPVESKLNELVHLQISVSGELYKNSREVYSNTAKRFLLLILVSLIFTFFLSLLIVRDTKGLILALEATNLKISLSEAKCRAFVEHAGDSIFILNEDTQIAEVNDAACSLLGYSRLELCSKKIAEIIPADELEKQQEYIGKIRNNEKVLTERRLKRKDGSEVDVEINTRLLTGTGFVAIMRDITERKRSELAVKDSEEKYRYLFNNNPAFVIIWDLEDMAVMEVNDAVLAKYGYTKDEWIGMSALKYRPVEDHEIITDFAKRMLNGGEPKVRTTWTHLKKNGEQMYMEIASHKIVYNNRKAILSLARDVTEQKKAEGELKKSEEKFRSLVDHAADSIFMVMDDGIIFDVNRSASELLQYTREELIGRTVLDLHPKDLQDHVYKIWDKLRKENSLLDERFLQRKDGSLVEVEISRRMLPDRSGAIAIVRDITERRKNEKALERSEERHRALTENISDAIMLVDEKFKNIYQSPSVERIVGFTLDDGKDRDIFEFVYPEDQELSMAFFQKAYQNPGIPFQDKFRVVHKLGHAIWIEGTVMNLLHNESVRAFIVNYRDITERINAEKEKLEIQEKTMALLEDKVVERTEELYEMNRILNYRNTEISDSINYAENIQRAILSKAQDCHQIFPDSFVLWMPKDVVSGDFLWCYENHQYGFIAVVDCTGHGVPAAMMSIIANQILDRVVSALGIMEPKDILLHLDESIVSSLKQESGIVKDGMDIAICRLDKKRQAIAFAGAQRPLFHYDGEKLNEISGDKSGVGGFIMDSESKIFSQKEITCHPGHSFYLTSDGYYSQFGGEKGKKLMKKRFAEYVSSITGRPLRDQRDLLQDFYKKWQGNEEQVDDVLVIGFKV